MVFFLLNGILILLKKNRF